jgi:uncharacterized protein DUF998
VARRLALAAPLLAAVAASVVTVAGLSTPGYDPVTRTVSRLAVPGMESAIYVDAAIAAMGIACLALTASVGRGRVPLVVAGLGFLGAALVHLDPASPASTAGHRAASALAVLGLVAAPFAARGYGRLSRTIGVLELATLAVAAPLLATAFLAWGIWERWLLALQLTWMVVIALKIASADDTTRTPAAMASSTGT